MHGKRELASRDGVSAADRREEQPHADMLPACRNGCWIDVTDLLRDGSAHIQLAMTHRVYKMSVAAVYPHYIAKAEKKGRTKAEVDAIIRWLTGYSQKQLEGSLEKKTDFETFFASAPQLNPTRSQIKGTICGIRVEEIEDPLMREIRYLDKLIDELAKGKAMEKILRE